MPYSKIDSSSTSAVPHTLDFFVTPPSNVGISSSVYREILTLNPVENPPYIFKLHPGSNFLDLRHIYLESRMQIQKLDGHTWRPIAATDKVGVIQAIGATWMRDVKVTVNGRETFNSNSLYAYKAYMDLELSFGREVKSTYFNASGYYPSRENSTNMDTKDDEGYKERAKLFAGGQVAEFFTRLNADIFSSDKLMVNNVAIEVEINPQPAQFVILDYETHLPAATAPEYRLALVGLKLFCKYVELMDGVSMDIANELERTPARYGIRRSELRSSVITKGRYEFQTTLFTDQLPRRIIVGLVDQHAHKGSWGKTPLKFGHYNVREITIYSGGKQWPAVPYNMRWDDTGPSFARCYNDMMEGVGFANSSESNGISPQLFQHGWCFFVFSLTADLDQSSAFELIKAGTTSIMIRFNTPVPDEGLTMIAYGEMDSLLMVDKNRQLTSDLMV